MIIFIAEDEPLAAQKLQFFLQKLGERAEDISIFDNGAMLVQAIDSGRVPALLFLDIQMPQMTGLEVLSRLQALGLDTQVIITSAYDRYAIDGFNYGVTDYLLKPYTLDRLRQALAKVRTAPVQEVHATPTIDIRCEGRTERIRVADIVCLQADKDYTQITLSDGRRLSTLGTLTSFEQQLPTQDFIRVQRSHIIALSHVRSYSSQSVTLTTGDTVPIGKTYRDAVEERIAK